MALDCAANGRTYFSPSLVADASRVQLAERRGRGAVRGVSLTRRQLEILELHCTAVRHQQIAIRLGISDRTVESHMRSLRAATGQPTNRHLVLWWTSMAADY
ncbi:MAG: response regulator transcription factor [Gemmatimonadales bacterium]|nr:response regulator transcription factor [Gemmatimonadales bacterium]